MKEIRTIFSYGVISSRGRNLKDIRVAAYTRFSVSKAMTRFQSFYKEVVLSFFNRTFLIIKQEFLRGYQGFANLFDKLFVSRAQLILNLSAEKSIGTRQIQQVDGRKKFAQSHNSVLQDTSVAVVRGRVSK